MFLLLMRDVGLHYLKCPRSAAVKLMIYASIRVESLLTLFLVIFLAVGASRRVVESVRGRREFGLSPSFTGRAYLAPRAFLEIYVVVLECRKRETVRVTDVTRRCRSTVDKVLAVISVAHSFLVDTVVEKSSAAIMSHESATSS